MIMRDGVGKDVFACHGDEGMGCFRYIRGERKSIRGWETKDWCSGGVEQTRKIRLGLEHPCDSLLFLLISVLERIYSHIR